MPEFAYAAALLFSGVVSGLLAAFAWSERRSRGSPELGRLFLAVTIWATCAALEALSPSLQAKVFWASAAYLGGATVPVFCLLFARSYLGHRWPARGVAALFVIPALTVALALTNGQHRLMYRGVTLVDTWAGPQGRYDHGPWYLVHTAFSYTLVGISLAWLWWSTRRAHHVRAMQGRGLILAFLIPLAGNLLYVLSPGVASGIDLTPMAFTLSGCVVLVAVHRHRLMRLGPLARSVLFEQMDDGVLFLDTELGIVDANAAALAMLGLPEGVDGSVRQLPRVGPTLATICEADDDAEREVELGEGRWVRLRCSRLSGPAGRTFGRLVVIQDVTRYRRAEAERIEMERQMQHTQKLESLGVLAGGIAHDFNNLLTVVLGRADLALNDAPRGSTIHSAVTDILTASRRAADLCRQMLAYSGRGHFLIGELDVNDLIDEMTTLLRTSVSKKVRLDVDLAADLPLVRGDATQIRQIVLNLITNASEAIGDRPGTIVVRTRVAPIDGESLHTIALGPQLETGDYVCLEVQDNGTGMAPDVVERMFEPFFSTKFTGRGLGLSAVLGIVRGHGGAIGVASTPGAGSEIRVFLPALARAVRPAAAQAPAAPIARAVRRNTVLLVDDEEMVRAVGAAMLGRLGYDVLAAAEGDEALRIFRAHALEVSVVILDLNMPGLDSNDVVRALRTVNPDLPVILCSGFTEPDAESRLTEPVIFLQKPYQLSHLAVMLADLVPGRVAEHPSGVRERASGRTL